MLTWFRKYSSILRASIITALEYKANSVVGLFAILTGLFIEYLIWSMIYTSEGEAYTILNSEILLTEGETVMEEGCLSIPDIRAEIKRPETILLKYQDLDKNYNERHFSGLISRAIQHEIDHLNGKLFIDYLGPMKRQLITRKMQKFKREKLRGDE